MFTGLIADLGSVKSVESDADGATLEISTALAGELAEGDSIAVNGVCLTATAIEDGAFRAQAMQETLRRSSLSAIAPWLARQPGACAARRRAPWWAYRAGPR